jgi:flagellar biosynthesis/type III secretory pathway protein FliH
MLEVHKLPLEESLLSVRLVSLQAPADSPTGQRASWLLQLGQAQVRRETETKILQSALQAMQKSLLGLQSTVNGRLDLVASQVVELSLAIAREIVGNALDCGLVDPTPTVIRCLRDCVHAADAKELIIYLHPDDLALVTAQLSRRPDLNIELGATRFATDPSLGRGAVRAETSAGRLRYDPAQMFERVAQAVRSAAAGGAQ